MIKGNKGEWSEFYAFIKILSDRTLAAADENLLPQAEKYFEVLQIIRDEVPQGKLRYDITGPSNTVSVIDTKGKIIEIIDISDLKSGVISIFKSIKEETGTTFSIDNADAIMTRLRCTQIKARSNQKADVFLVIHDRISPVNTELGFSVKSMLGSPSTLLNASSGTNFTYQIDGDVQIGDINMIEGRSKIRDRLEFINSQSSIAYSDVESANFKRNLRKIDTVLPKILAEIVKAYYEGKGRDISTLVDSLVENGSLKDYDLDRGDYEFKVKQFLVAIALGLTPQSEWNGLTSAHGGYIVVKDNGDIVAYHLYNRDEFMEYLYRNTCLDTPSTTRHRHGYAYDENGIKKIKLNLQIRFKH